jgi:hypothetical protein
MRDSITSQLVRKDLSRLTLMEVENASEKLLSSLTIAAFLEKYIHHFTVLVNGSPQVLLLTINLHEHFVNVKGITEPLVFSFQSLLILRAKFIAPQPDRFIADDNYSFC